MAPASQSSADARGRAQIPHSRCTPTARFVGLHVLGPLAVGAAIYLLWRTSELRLFGWLDLTGLGDAVHRARALAAPLRPALPSWTLYSLPDGLWVYAVTSFMCRVWGRGAATSTWGRREIWIAAGPAAAIGWELAQLLGLAPGTFDPFDLVVCGLAGAIALAVHTPAPMLRHGPEVIHG